MSNEDKKAKNKAAASTMKTAPAEPKPEVTDDAASASSVDDGEGWDAVGEAVKKAKEGGIFLKLEDDGESFTGVVMGKPYVRQVTFDNSEFTKKGKPNKPSTRIAINVAVLDEKTKEFTSVKVYEQGPVFFKKMLTVKEKFSFDKWAITITRNGKSRDPKTDYVILPDHQLTEGELAIIGALELHDLKELSNPESFDPEKLEADAAE